MLNAPVRVTVAQRARQKANACRVGGHAALLRLKARQGLLQDVSLQRKLLAKRWAPPGPIRHGKA